MDKRPRYLGDFAGLYNVTVTFMDNRSKAIFKRVFVDNEQWNRFHNLRITDEKGQTILIVKSDIKLVSWDCKDCQR